MSYIELKRKDGARFLYDPQTQWEIDDNGPDHPAWWGNASLGMNKDCGDTYEAVKAKLLGDAGAIVQVSGFSVANTSRTQCEFMLVGLTRDGRIVMSTGDRKWTEVGP